MEERKKVEYRYYDIPNGEIVLPLMGPKWNKVYGEGRDKLHFHNYYEIGLCHEGQGEMILGDRQISFCPNCISIIPPSELHTTNTFGEIARWDWLYFDLPELLKELYPNDADIRDNIRIILYKRGDLLTPNRETQKLQFLIQGILSEMAQKEYMYQDMVKHLLTSIIIEIIRKTQNVDIIPENVSIKIDIVSAIDFIKENYNLPIKINELAHICNMSESFFRKTFERYMNMKPLDYVNFVRVQKSCAILRATDRPIAEIAGAVGYESTSSYIRNFKKIIGHTPHQWRTDEEYEKTKFIKYNVTALRGWLD